LSWIQFASVTVNTVVLLDESRDDVYRLKPVRKNECYYSGLIVKSFIFLIYLMLLISWVSWLKEIPYPL
jgi:hypothetical protein